jgi:hypothetical protein
LKNKDKVVITSANACHPMGTKGVVVGQSPVEGWAGMLVHFDQDSTIHAQFVRSDHMALA